MDHGARKSVMPPAALTSSTESALRWSYLAALPFFHIVAVITNVIIFCIFSSRKLQRYRASVFFRFSAMVDMILSFLVFGLMWLAVLLPSLDPRLAERRDHCRLYTVLRYTTQDLSAWGVAFLVMERCSAAVARARRSTPSCLLVTVGNSKWVLRHISSKIFLGIASLFALIMNMKMVFSSMRHLPDSENDNLDCFDSWKDPRDFVDQFCSLPMSHALLSILTPCFSCMLCCGCLYILTRPPSRRVLRLDYRRNAPSFRIGRNTRRQSDRGNSTRTRWTSLGFHKPRVDVSVNVSVSKQKLVDDELPDRDFVGYSFTHPVCAARIDNDARLVSVAVTTSAATEVTEIDKKAPTSSIVGRIRDFVKSRAVVLSVVEVQDRSLVAEPPADLARDFSAMAAVVAVFFLILSLPQILYMVVGVMNAKQADEQWPLMKNLGKAMDLVSNNRINFTLFLYVFVSGQHMTRVLLRVLATFSSSFLCSCWLTAKNPHRSLRGSRIIRPACPGQGRNMVPNQGQGQNTVPNQGQGQNPSQGRKLGYVQSQCQHPSGQCHNLGQRGETLAGCQVRGGGLWYGPPCVIGKPFCKKWIGMDKKDDKIGQGQQGVGGGQGQSVVPKVSIMTPS